jgi:predicted phosphoribosyltransferase
VDRQGGPLYGRNLLLVDAGVLVLAAVWAAVATVRSRSSAVAEDAC